MLAKEKKGLYLAPSFSLEGKVGGGVLSGQLPHLPLGDGEGRMGQLTSLTGPDLKIHDPLPKALLLGEVDSAISLVLSPRFGDLV